MKRDRKKPPKTGGYLGAKGGSGVYQTIIAAMPYHDLYIEACLGSGVIMREKPPVLVSLGCDSNIKTCQSFYDREGADRNRMIVMRYNVFELIPLIERHPEGVLVYYDPPYPSWTRTGFNSHNYGEFEWSKTDHIKFLLAIKNSPAKAMVSTYPNDLYEEYLTPDRGWRYIDIPSMTHGGPRIERLYMNFPAGKPYHHKFAGKDFTDRQRIQRKAASAGRRFGNIDNEGERLAILAAMLATYG